MRKGRNLLSGEQSPYLQLHADNPIEWHPWGEGAFEKARTEDKPIFLSIGYSACHWCRVMERESFCDEEVANLVNDACIPVKVDREERPDIDGVFMAVCQMLNGNGGWPLNVFLTPEGLPFFAATYLPKRSGGAIPGMVDIVPRVKWLFKTQRTQVESSARSVRDSLLAEEDSTGQGSLPGIGAFKKTFDELSASFDREWGGFSKAPKFPMSTYLLFLIRYFRKFGVKSAWSMVERTIERIWEGGIHDHLAGGGHIQSADHVQQRGFTAAGGSHDGYKFALFYGEGHTIQGSGNVRLCAIIFFQFSRLQNAHREHHPFFLINPL